MTKEFAYNQILELLSKYPEGLSVKSITESFKFSPNCISNSLKKLLQLGLIEKLPKITKQDNKYKCYKNKHDRRIRFYKIKKSILNTNYNE